MTLEPIAAIPAIASAAVIYSNSVEAAFFRIYLPVLLLLPDGFDWGWPPMTFHEFAIFPIGLALCWSLLSKRWVKSWTDVVVIAFLGWTIASEVHANGSEDIFKTILQPFTIAFFPYMAGKLLIEQSGMRYAVARRFVFLVFLDSVISVFEFRFEVNPFQRLASPFFSNADPWGSTQLRFGFGRIAGPFGHAILMGEIIAIAILLQWYMMHLDAAPDRFRWLPKLNKPWTLLGGLVAGSLMTISRGPWLAAIAGIAVASVGYAQHQWRALGRTFMVLAVGGTLVYFAGKHYISGADRIQSPDELASAVYRAQLIDQYKQIALVQKFWGWGASPNWPRVPGMASIDNWYLLVTLMHGETGLLLFCLMMLVATGRLFWGGMAGSQMAAQDRAFLFTFTGILTSACVALATVYLGSQLYPILFLFLGWSDSCLVSRKRREAVVPVFAFQKVIA